MKLTYLASATVIVEAGGKRILCDPWLVDGAYYGAWAHYPPFDWDRHGPKDIDYIYVSHIHPDHLCTKTFQHLDRRIPVLIHAYEFPFLKANIEAMGFAVWELPHNMPADLGNGVSLAILAADDCDPRLCGLAFGCDAIPSVRGSAQIDTLSVISDGKCTIVNVNDCPYGLAKTVLPKVKSRYGEVDLLLTGYSGAGPYPQCFEMPAEAMFKAAEAKKRSFLTQAQAFIADLKPRMVLPFAGQYTLCGRLVHLNDWRGVPDMADAVRWLGAKNPDTGVLYLETGGEVDVASGHATSTRNFDQRARRRYRDTVLAGRMLSYEDEPWPKAGDIEDLLQAAYQRLERRRQAIGYRSDTIVYLPVGTGFSARISLNGGGMAFTSETPRAAPQYVQLTLDPRLLKRVLSGPRHAHWNNAEIGSHILFRREPDVYDRGLYALLYSLHA